MLTSRLRKSLAAFVTLGGLWASMSPTLSASITHQRAQSGQHVILLEGAIAASDIVQMRKALKASEGAVAITVLLDSPGGVLYPAMEIGRMIRRVGASTVAVRQCASACHVIWAGGESRFVVSGSQLAIHYPYRDAKSAKQPAFDAYSDLVNYYRQMGATPELALDIAASDPNQLKVLSLNDAKRHGLAFATLDQ